MQLTAKKRNGSHFPPKKRRNLSLHSFFETRHPLLLSDRSTKKIWSKSFLSPFALVHLALLFPLSPKNRKCRDPSPNSPPFPPNIPQFPPPSRTKRHTQQFPVQRKIAPLCRRGGGGKPFPPFPHFPIHITLKNAALHRHGFACVVLGGKSFLFFADFKKIPICRSR